MKKLEEYEDLLNIPNIHADVKGQTENALQQKCVFWFHNNFSQHRGLLFAVPNGGLRDKKSAKILKLTGVVRGVSDLILLDRGRAFLIELKRNKEAKQSPHQELWQDKVESHGFHYFIISSLTDFKALVNSILT